FLGNLPAAFDAVRESRQIIERQSVAEPNRSGLKLRLAAALYREGLILDDPGAPNLGPREAAVEVPTRGIAACWGGGQRDSRDAISRTYIAMLTMSLGGISQDADPAGALKLYDHALDRLDEVPPTQTLRDYYRVYLLAQSTGPLHKLGRQPEVDRRI